MAPLPHSPQAPRPGLARYSRALLLAAPLVLAACGGGSDDPGIAVAPSDFAVDYSPKGYTFHWSARTGATRYELFEDPDGAAGPLPEVQIGGTIASTSYAHSLAGQLLHERLNASYRLRACDANGCGAWTAALTPDLTQAIGRFEGGREGSYSYISHVVLSANGTTLAVGAPGEHSADGLPDAAGAVYLFSRDTPAGTWQQQAHLKASNLAQGANFGAHLALSSDGDTLAVGAPQESSNARGINGDGSNSDAPGAGAVYVFTRNGGNWSQQAYVKARNTPRKSSAVKYSSGAFHAIRWNSAPAWPCRPTGICWPSAPHKKAPKASVLALPLMSPALARSTLTSAATVHGPRKHT